MNIAEILKQLPEGTKLYSPIFGEVSLLKVQEDFIKVDTFLGSRVFSGDGKFTRNGECMLFPAKNQSWYDYQIPFTHGDIIIMTEPSRPDWIPNIAIFKDYEGDNPDNPMRVYCQFDASGKFLPYEMNVSINQPIWRKANAQEIAGFIKEMHEAGYQFIGNKIIKIVKPKFKVGDIITNGKLTLRIDVVDSKYYIEGYPNVAYRLPISDQHHWKIKKFDVHTLKPYDKVLVKRSESSCWVPTLVSYVNSSGTVYTLDSDDGYEQVIPFEGHECFAGNYNDPEPYYITWKND